jgi:hypothetical protein
VNEPSSATVTRYWSCFSVMHAFYAADKNYVFEL